MIAAVRAVSSAASPGVQVVVGSLILVGTLLVVLLGYRPVRSLLVRQEQMFDEVLRGKLLIDIRPRTATVLSMLAMALLGLVCFALADSLIGALIGLVAGALLPYGALRYLRKRRLERLDDQLVSGIQTLSSGVRAGLNLVQAMELIARDGPIPLRQEFAHLTREYEFGVSLEEAMSHAAERIGSGDYRLLFAALRTHRERGGDLGDTLDRIAASIREIQRLENRVKTLTAQPRATARWLSVMPLAVLGILYVLVDPDGVKLLFADDLGKVIVLAMILLNVAGYLWIRKIADVDI